jgi:DNA-binding response OmpR family regulator
MKNILIVEDDKSIAELERDYLEAEGFIVDIVHTGDRGQKMALENNYALILLDIMLPNADGFSILREVRKTKNTPVILISAKKEDFDKIRGLGLGADDYMTKPFSPSEMVARVKAHIARHNKLTGSERNREETINIRGLEVNNENKQVIHNGQNLSLTSKEFDILYLLMSNPNRVFSKQEIFNSIWGDSSFGDISTITVHIRKIREKIESDPSNPIYIDTLWGIGYRFNL